MCALPFRFPPDACGKWRHLNEEQRGQWLDCACDRFFDPDSGFAPSKERGRVVEVDGRIVDNLLGFFCAMGEAVNGPGGYFGLSLQGFDDCLFSGFGLDPPYTIRITHSHEMRRALSSRALLDYLEAVKPPEHEEGRAWLEETREAALRGHRSLFDEIEECILSVFSRGGGQVLLLLD